MAKSEFDEYSDKYVETVEDSFGFSGLSHEFFMRSKADIIEDLVDRHLGASPSKNLLDIGCGVGALHPFIEGRFDSVSGVDVSADSVARAAEDHPENEYRVYDGETLPYADGAFDMTLAVCVMHHVPPKQWRRFLEEMRRVVRPGGLVCLIEHNPINPATRLSVARCPFDADAVLLGMGEMRKQLLAAGLGDVAVRNFVFFPSNRSFFRSLERNLSWLPLGAQYAATGTA